MFEKLKEMFSLAHVALVLLGAILAAGVAWGTGTTKIEDHERRLSTTEAAQRQDIKDLRDEMSRRFDQLSADLRAARTR